MNTYLIIWGATFALMVIAELCTLQLVSIWFAAGAAAAFGAAYFGFELWVQLVAFVAVSLVLLIATRPLLKKVKVQDTQPTNAEIDIGKTAVVIEDIYNAYDKGRARLHGVDWKARSSDGTRIPKDTIVTIDDMKGSKLYVSVANQVSMKDLINGGNKK